MNEKWIIRILKSKENRRIFQKKLIKRFNNTIISFTLNTPGEEKDNKDYRKIHRQAFDYIIDSLRKRDIDILYKERFELSTGPEGYIVVDEDGKRIKSLMIEIEEKHFLGRLFDIDIFNKNMKQISRKDLNLKERKCLLCNNEARVCMRNRTHNLKELIEETNKLIREYFDLTKK